MSTKHVNPNHPHPWHLPPPPKEYDPAHQLEGFESEPEVYVRAIERHLILYGGTPQNRCLGYRIMRCNSSRPCGSAACPKCLRRFRQVETGRFLTFHSTLDMTVGQGYAVTIIPENAGHPAGELATRDIAKSNRALRRRLARSPLANEVVIGGWDFSFNDHSSGLWPPHWQPHLYLIFPLVTDRAWLKAELMKLFSKADGTPRPIRVVPFKDPLDQFTYAVKSAFKLRRSYLDSNDKPKTNALPLPIHRDRELLVFLDKLGWADRMFLRNVKRQGSLLVRCHHEILSGS